MKITRGSVTITDVPFFHHIEVQAENILLSGDGDFVDQTFSVEAIEALRDALTEAIRIKREMDGTPATPVTSQSVFHAGSDEPGPEVMKVRDAGDDVWIRSKDGWGIDHADGESEWETVLQYAPLTDITND